jgi:malonyl-CoA/methylmalonyl-CoA synthetase
MSTPPPANVHDVLRRRAGSPGDDARIWLVDVATGRTITYGELDRRTAQVVHALRDLGVRAGDRVAVQVDKSPDALITYLGTVRAGAAFLPLNTAYRSDEVAYFLTDATPSLAIGRPGDTAFTAAASSAGVEHVLDLGADGDGTWAELVQSAASTDPGPSATRPDDLATVVYTSGTTGRSKGAMLSHRNLSSNAEALVELWRITADDTLIHALPIFHVHGLFVATHTAMLAGAPILLHRSFDPAAVIADMARATVFMGVPTMYVRLLAQPALDRATCAGMRLFVSGSAPLLPETFHELRARTGHTILERYGMTETGMITSNPCDGERRGGTVGPALPGVEVRTTADGATVHAGVTGDVEVRGPNVLLGYWNRPDARTTEFTADGWFRTGDVGRFDDDGYLELVGRSKDLVISGGYNVYPKEVELLLDAVPGVVESAVIGLPDADFGEAVTAVLTVTPGTQIDAAALIADLKSRLAPYKVPKSVHVVDELPRNAMGKVQKNVLRDHFAPRA